MIKKTNTMKQVKLLLLTIVISSLVTSCGVDGDPGHCYFAVDWEWYNSDYGVYYYEDDNPAVPESELIVAAYYYDSYPNTYDYYYESEDYSYWYSYEGNYTLVQNPGFPGVMFRDGLDGADTYVDLYLSVYAKKGLSLKEPGNSPGEDLSIKELSRSGRTILNPPLEVINRSWEQSRGEWTIKVIEEVKVYRK